jgi:dienelactone hydrolase
VEFESASQRLNSIEVIPGDRIQGYLAKPEGGGPFPAVIGLHGCAGMHDTTKQRLTDDLVAWGYVILLVDSYATRGIEHACTSTAFATVIRRTRDAYGALVFLARQTFVDPQRVAAVGFSAGAWVTLSVAEPNSFELFVPPSNLRFQAAAAFYPPCQQAAARPAIPTLIFIGTLDDWTPAADCSNKVAAWGNDGPPIDLVVYPGAPPQFLLPALSARQDHVGSLAGIQRRGSGQCKSPPAPVSRSPSQLKARRQRQQKLTSFVGRCCRKRVHKVAPSARVRKRFLEGVLGRNSDSLTGRERNKILSNYCNRRLWDDLAGAPRVKRS